MTPRWPTDAPRDAGMVLVLCWIWPHVLADPPMIEPEGTPVQSFNLPKMIQEHLPGEHRAVTQKIGETQEALRKLTEYADVLRRIGREVGLTMEDT